MRDGAAEAQVPGLGQRVGVEDGGHADTVGNLGAAATHLGQHHLEGLRSLIVGIVVQHDRELLLSLAR